MLPLTLDDFPPLFLRLVLGAFGLLWGSFLNVVIYRVPRGMSVVRPASHCPGCGKPIKPWQNVPLFGWLFLRGRAACCGVAIPFRYPMVEAIGGVLSLAILELILFRLDPATSVGRAGAIYCADLALVLGLTAASFIDLEHMILPNSITYGGAVLGFATASFRDLSFLDSAIGAAAGFAVIYVPFVLIYPRLRGKAGMGLGDAKLMACAGAWFGWKGALFVLGAGALQGTVAAIGMLVARGKIEEPEAVKREREELKAEVEADLAAMTPEERAEAEAELAKDPLYDEPGEGLGAVRMPFGPFLALATIEFLFFGREILDGYLSFLG